MSLNNAATLTLGSDADTIIVDSWNGSSAATVSDFAVGEDKLNINAVLNTLTGWDGSSNPFGSGSMLIGGNGNDRLIGGDGADTLTGGFGADAFVFGGPAEGGNITRAKAGPPYRTMKLRFQHHAERNGRIVVRRCGPGVTGPGRKLRRRHGICAAPLWCGRSLA